MRFDSLVMPGQKKDGSEKRFLIYRGDMECDIAPGNKQHKLKYHLQEAVNKGSQYIATFGGPHSNHIAAFVASCLKLSLTPLVVVRGETWADLTPTLRSAVNAGAILFPSARQDYRLGLSSSVKHAIDQCYANVHWIPEGGAGPLGVKGCLDWANDIRMCQEAHDAHVCVASGTSATASGFSASGFESVSVFSALKGAKHIEADIYALCEQANLTVKAALTAYDECLHGGFGRMTPELVCFLKALYQLNPTVMLDPIYTSKMVYRVHQLNQQGQWPYKKTLFVHTGGLQGWRGMKLEQQPYGDPMRFSC